MDAQLNQRLPFSKREHNLSRRSRPVRLVRLLPFAKVNLVSEDGHPIPCTRFRLNAVGLYLYSDLLLCQGDRLHFSVQLAPTEEPFGLDAQVVHTDSGENGRPAGMGFVFRHLSIAHKKQLQSYVARRYLSHVD